MYLSAGFNHTELPLKAYVAEKPDMPASAIMQSDFTPCDYANAFSEDGTVWLETEIPSNTAVREREVLYFSPELRSAHGTTPSALFPFSAGTAQDAMRRLPIKRSL